MARRESDTWTPALRHGAGRTDSQLLYHSGEVTSIPWGDIRPQAWRYGPWMNHLKFTPTVGEGAPSLFTYEEIMDESVYPGH